MKVRTNLMISPIKDRSYQTASLPLGLDSVVHFVEFSDFNLFAHEVVFAAEYVEKLVHQVIEQ